MVAQKSKAVENLEASWGTKKELGPDIPDNLRKSTEYKQPDEMIAFIVVLISFVSVMIWSSFVPVLDFSPEGLFKFTGTDNVLELLFSFNFLLFLFLSPVTYGFVSAIGLRKVRNGGLYAAVGAGFAILLSWIIFSWPLEYLITGLAYAGFSMLVYSSTRLGAREIKKWISFRASKAGAGKAVIFSVIIFSLVLGASIVPNQDAYFDAMIFSALTYGLPSDSGSGSQALLQACTDQIVEQLEAPTPINFIVEQLEQDPAYVALPTTELKEDYIQRIVVANESQKNVLIEQLRNAPAAAPSVDREAQIELAYKNVIESSPLFSDLSRIFGFLVVISVYLTLMSIVNISVIPLAGIYAVLFERLFNYGNMF